jgi:hypothetical protein
MMNSFLFNVLLLGLAAPVVIQFCSIAFSVYSRFTGIDLIFNIGVRYLRGIKYFWFYYHFPLLGLAVLTFIYLLIFPADRRRGQDYVDTSKLP